MDRVRKISMEVLSKHRADFGTNFDENKVALESLSIIRSKILKNKIAGRITRTIKKELYEQEEKRKNEQATTTKSNTSTESQEFEG